jgi:hypothetical protein
MRPLALPPPFGAGGDHEQAFPKRLHLAGTLADVKAHPYAAWAAQQLVEAFGPDGAFRLLIRDRDTIFGAAFDHHALDRGGDFITYARYLDDMVVLAPDSDKGRKWADRALERIRREAEAIGVSLNTEKTRVVSMTEPRAVFALLGFEFRWVPSAKTGRWYPHLTPRRKQLRAAAIGARHAPGQQAPADTGGCREGERDHPRLGELLPGGQFESGVRQRAVHMSNAA